MARKRIFTIFDKMDQDGVFDSNPANIQSRGPQGQVLYTGPVKFPRMVYEPKGLFRITTQAEAVATPLGPKLVGEQRELISRVAETEGEYLKLKAEGWLETPADAIAINPGRRTAAELAAVEASPTTSGSKTAETALAAAQREIAAQKKKIAELEAAAE